jgi:hypothetical protein
MIDKPGYRLGTDDPDPAKRLNAMLYTVGGDDFYGVLRMSLMRRMPDFSTCLHPDPKRASRLLHPKVRLVAEYLLSFPRAIHGAPLSRLQGARGYWAYLGWIATHAAPARYRARQQGTAGVALH